MEASVRLRWILAGALVVQEELLEASGSRHIVFCLRSRGGRNTCLCGSNPSMQATRSGEAKNGQRPLQGTSRTAPKLSESSCECHNKNILHWNVAFVCLRPSSRASVIPNSHSPVLSYPVPLSRTTPC